MRAAAFSPSFGGAGFVPDPFLPDDVGNPQPLGVVNGPLGDFIPQGFPCFCFVVRDHDINGFTIIMVGARFLTFSSDVIYLGPGFLHAPVGAKRVGL